MQPQASALRISRPGRLLGLAGLLLLMPIACASAPPNGPRFRPQSAPSGDLALVYLYRQDSLRGVGAVDVEIDGEPLGRLGDGQYMALVLTGAPHRVSLRLKRFGFIPTSWTHFAVALEPGEASFVRVWAGYEERDTGPESRSLEVPGRSSRHASVGIFAGRKGEREGLADLASSYQVKVVKPGSSR